jgi:signal transduction histidine kinase
MTAFVGSYSKNFKSAAMQNIAGAMAVYVKRDYKNHSGVNSSGRLFKYSEDFQTVVDLLSSETRDTTIFVVDRTGSLCAFGSAGHIAPGSFFSVPSIEAYLPGSLRSRLVSGEVVSETDDMEGLLQNECIYTAHPLFIDGAYVGSVVVATSDSGMDSMMRQTVMTLIMASLWIMLASLTAVYVISEKMTTPIRKMNAAAKKMAKGNFDTRVEVRGRDEIAELSASFNDMATSLGNLERMRSSFISDVSHELRTPMTTIGGFIDSILDGAIPPEKEHYYLELVSSEIKRLSRLVTSLLEVSRLESGGRKLKIEAFDICEMARTILISNEQRLEEKRLDVSFVCDEDNIDVVADRDSIYQCLFNICDNAIKFSREGGRYEVSVKNAGERVEVSVFNEGIGISDDDLPFVFERFYKSDKSRGLDKKGVGLGLYLVKSMIEAHGETIRCESKSGEWCRFTFTLHKKKN